MRAYSEVIVLRERNLAQSSDVRGDHPDGRRWRSCASRFFVLFLLGLVTLLQLQRGLAVPGVIWETIPSWDNPVTNAFEDSVGLTPPYADPTREARERTSVALRPLGRFVHSHGPGFFQTPTLSSRLNRSPPAA